MKIKPAGKIAIFLAIGVIIFFAVKRFMPANKADDPTTSIENTSPTTSTNRGETKPGNNTSGSNTSATESREFNYTPEKPVNATLRGVVEVGATGFNSFVINMDREKRWNIVSKDFGESLAYEGLATTEDIRAGLKKYLSNMFAKGVNKKDMHFVISSGAQKEPKTGIISNELKKLVM